MPPRRTGRTPRSRRRRPRAAIRRAASSLPIAAIADGPLRSPTTGMIEVARLQALQELKRVFGGQVVGLAAGSVGIGQKLAIGRIVAARRPAGALEPQRQALRDEAAMESIDASRKSSADSVTPLRVTAASTRARNASIARGDAAARRHTRRGDRSARRASASMSAGTGRPRSCARYSTRVATAANSALNSRCSSRLSRRTSTMNAIDGRVSAM